MFLIYSHFLEEQKKKKSKKNSLILNSFIGILRGGLVGRRPSMILLLFFPMYVPSSHKEREVESEINSLLSHHPFHLFFLFFAFQDNTTGKFIQLMKFATHPPLSVIDSWSSLLQTNITNARIFYWYLLFSSFLSFSLLSCLIFSLIFFYPPRSRYFYTNSSFSIAWNVNIDLYDRKVVLPYWV